MKKLRLTIPLQIHCQHVKGHQDVETDFNDLERSAQVNVLMDLEAKSLLDQLSTTGHNFSDSFPPHPLSFTTVQHDNSTITDQMTEKLYRSIADTKIFDYWMEKKRFTRDQIEHIDWQNQERAIKLVSLSRRRFVSKWAMNYVATGKNLKRWKMRHHSYCPFCEEEDEDVHHILHCTHDEAQRIFHSTLWTLMETLMKIGTCTRAVMAIRNEIIAWRNDSTYPDTEDLGCDLAEVILAQRDLGWRAFLDGLLTTKWAQYQKIHFELRGSKRSHNLWVSKTIRACWSYNVSIWTARNEQVHKTDRIKDLEGRKEIIKAINNEYRIGLGRLPAYGFSYMFKKDPNELTKSSMDSEHMEHQGSQSSMECLLHQRNQDTNIRCVVPLVRCVVPIVCRAVPPVPCVDA